MKSSNKEIYPAWTGTRKAKVGGKEVTVTHRNPSNGDLWCEGINNDPEKDCWVPADKVEIL